MGSEKAAEAMKTVRDAKNSDIRALKQKLEKYKNTCAGVETAMEVEHQGDMDTLKR
jgi:hypothetical protein